MASREARVFIELALGRMMSRARGVEVAVRPDLDGANSVYGLVVHCLGVADWWLGHAVLGHATDRDRDAEFEATGTLAELETMVAAFTSRLPDLLDEVAANAVPVSSNLERVTASSREWPWTTASIVLHVVEELFQHAGHVDITADLVLA